jgi:hypothetical protein
VAVIILVLGNLATFAGSVNAINTAIFDFLGLKPLELIYYNARILVGALLTVGYAFALYWVFRKFKTVASGLKKRASMFALFVLIAAAYGFNLHALPRRPKPESLIKRQLGQWSDRIFASQAPNGGFRMEALNASVPPQVWTTAQCLKAVLTAQEGLERQVQQVRSAFDYIEGARRSQPEEGWGLFENSPETVTEVAGWVTLAYIASIDSRTPVWNESEVPGILGRIERNLAHIVSRQEDGGWRPISERAQPPYQPYTRTYSTAIAIWSLIEARRSQKVYERIRNRYDDNIRNGAGWLLKRYDPILGWVPNPNRDSQRERFDGLTAQVLFILSRAETDFTFLASEAKYVEAESDFAKKGDLVRRLQCNSDRIHDSDQSFPPTTFVMEGSTMLWFPWSFAELTHLSGHVLLPRDAQNAAGQLRDDILRSNLDEMNKYIDSEYMYVLAENLFCLSFSTQKENGSGGSSGAG